MTKSRTIWPWWSVHADRRPYWMYGKYAALEPLTMQKPKPIEAETFAVRGWFEYLRWECGLEGKPLVAGMKRCYYVKDAKIQNKHLHVKLKTAKAPVLKFVIEGAKKHAG